MTAEHIIVLIISYLVGSIPFGVVFAKTKGVDLRKVGSGNIGATNVLRSVGKKEAILTLLGDLLKGTFAVLLMKLAGGSEAFVAMAGAASVLGHDFSVYLKFKGGKGVATSLGVVFAYAPFVGLLTLCLWLFMAFVFRYSSLAALVSFALLPLNMIIFHIDKSGVVLGFVITGLIFLKHRANIKRLLEGSEPRIGRSS